MPRIRPHETEYDILAAKVDALGEKQAITLATGAILYVRGGMMADLVLNGYKTRFSYASGEYSPGSKAEITIPSQYRPANQVYGHIGASGGRVLITGGGVVTMQPNGALNSNVSIYAHVTYAIA